MPHLRGGIMLRVLQKLVRPDPRPCPLQGVPVRVLVKGDLQRVLYVLGYFPQGWVPRRRSKDPLTDLNHSTHFSPLQVLISCENSRLCGLGALRAIAARYCTKFLAGSFHKCEHIGRGCKTSVF